MARSILILVALVGCDPGGKGGEDDGDGDGVPASDDCDDGDPARSPRNDEIPYDGIDNDCSLVAGSNVDPDDLDVDRDLFPAMTQAEYEALPGAHLDFPPGFVGKGIDCDDTDPDVHPDQSLDVPYDGIDGDCARDNDFDADGDGWSASFRPTGEPVTDAEVRDYIDRYAIPAGVTDAWGPDGAGPAQAGDCEDTRPDWHPGAVAEEVAYDGKDEDCDGADDFDADADGHLLPGSEDEHAAFLRRYFLEDPGLPFDDCADGPDQPTLPQLSVEVAATVHPGAADPWYDGVDQDCARDDDFDQDLDGIAPPGDGAAAAAFALAWGYEREPWADRASEGDCDDTDPAIGPGGLDLLWNGLDEDCDGTADQSTFRFDPTGTEITWVEPANPELLFLEGREFQLFTLATQATVDGVRLDLAGRSIAFDAGAMGPAEPTSVLEQLWLRNIFALDPDTVLHPWIDLAGRDPDPIDRDSPPSPPEDPGAWIVSGALAAVGGEFADQINLGEILSLGTPSQYVVNIVPRQNSPAHPVGPITGLDVAPLLRLADPGYRTGASVVCVPEHLHAKLGDGSFALLQTDPTGPFTADTCFFDQLPIEGDITVEACDDGNCQLFEIDEAAATFTAGASLPDEHWAWGDWEDGHTLLVDVDGAASVRADGDPTLVPWFAGETIDTFDLVDAGAAGLYAVGVTTDGRVLLESQDPVNGVRTQTLDAVDPTFAAADPAPYGVAVEVGNGRLAVAVTLRDGGGPGGSVGWTFLGLP